MCIRNTSEPYFFIQNTTKPFVCIETIYTESHLYMNPGNHLWVLLCLLINSEPDGKPLTSCSCRNRPSSSVTALDLSASCFCSLIIITLLSTCDLRDNTRVLLSIHVRNPELFVYTAGTCVQPLSSVWCNGKNTINTSAQTLFAKSCRRTEIPQNFHLFFYLFLYFTGSVRKRV